MTGGESAIVSAAGIIVGLTLREIPSIIAEKVLLRKHKQTDEQKANGNGKRLEMRGDMKEVFVDTLKQDILPVLNRQTEILEAIAETNGQMKDGILVLVDRGKRR